MRFNRSYFLLTLLFFVAEIFIGKYMHDSIIRPFGGDFLVVILLYCFIKTFFKTPLVATAVSVLLLAYIIEIAQYFHLLNHLGWQHSQIAVLLLGTSFSYTDLLCYSLGISLVLAIENIKLKTLEHKSLINKA